MVVKLLPPVTAKICPREIAASRKAKDANYKSIRHSIPCICRDNVLSNIRSAPLLPTTPSILTDTTTAAVTALDHLIEATKKSDDQWNLALTTWWKAQRALEAAQAESAAPY